MNIKSRLLKLEKDNGVYIDFDINRPLIEWSRAELIAYVKTIDPTYEPQDMIKLGRYELRAIVYGKNLILLDFMVNNCQLNTVSNL